MEDYYAHRNSSHRYTVKKIDDSGAIQLIDGDGLTDETHTKIMRVYPHGFSSHSVDDSHMVVIGQGGRRDMIVAFGGEHADKRPKNLSKGDTILYNAEGDAIRIFKKTVDITHAKNIKLSIGKGLKDSSSGGGKEADAGEDKPVTVVITENDITITKGGAVIKLNDDQISVKHPQKIVVDAAQILLGEDATLPVKLCDDSCATKVFAK